MNHSTQASFLGAAGLAALFIACGSRSLTEDSGDYSGSGFSSGSTASSTVGGSGGSSFRNTAGADPAAGGVLVPTLPPGGPFAEDFPPNGTQVISEDQYSNLTNGDMLRQFCNTSAVEAEPYRSVIEFLVDVSGSMLSVTASTGGLSKWDVTRRTLIDAVQRLPPTVGVGVVFFPNMDASASFTTRPTSTCVDSSLDVPIALATPVQVALIQSALDAVEPFPAAATPTYEAYGVAVNQLLNTTVPGTKYIVLITDGQPTQGEECIGSGATCDTVTPTPVAPIIHAMDLAYLDHEITTFVVGAPGSETIVCTGEDLRPWLSEAALYGNTGSPGCSVAGPNYCHFDLSAVADFGMALGDALKNITDTLITCAYQVPPSPDPWHSPNPATTSMLYSTGTGEFFLLLPSQGGCALGWNFTDATNSLVQICGPTCELLHNNPAGKLTVLIGCGGGPIPTIQ